jgi:tetratricopeptide (TPR) repeat protein
MAHFRAIPVLAALLVGGVAHAADRGLAVRVDTVEMELSETEARAERLSRDYEHRRGLIGSEEAMQRYEDAVYAYLVGDHERAAMGFFVLVEAEALEANMLHHDSQWYLGESLFELGNWNTALDAYDLIVKSGEKHPFFGDAVRRQLEVYGILNDPDSFYELYRTWILSGRVTSTEAVKYTVAKSFWRQGEIARAKAMFTELPVGGEYYGKARYFMGAILASEGEFEPALLEFRKVVDLESIDPDVAELSWLALGRLNYELARYDDALEAYQHIPAGSDLFADQLYEMVWAYIKQGDWDSALQQSEIFLIAFSEHPYALQLKLDMGHLHMKNVAFEKALAAYETVVDDYTPLQRQLARLEEGREDPGAFFNRMVEGEALSTGDGALPHYAMALLTENDDIARAVQASRELRQQRDDVADSESTAREIQAVLGNSNDAIGTFARGRSELTRVRDDALGLRARLLRLEIDVLADVGGPTLDNQLPAKVQKLDVLVTRSGQVQDVESASSDRYQAHEDQVRAVQSSATSVSRLNRDLQAELAATRRAWLDKRPEMSVADGERVGRELEKLDGFLTQAGRDLGRLESDAIRRSVMASVPRARGGETETERALLAEDFERMHRALRTLRDGAPVSGSAELLSKLDQLWLRSLATDTKSVSTLGALTRAEGGELAILRKRLAEQTAAVTRLGGDLRRVDSDAEEVAAAVTRTGFGLLEDELFETIMRADRGIVDVYWLRKTEVADEKIRLATERADRLQEMDARFGLIRQKLEE